MELNKNLDLVQLCCRYAQQNLFETGRIESIAGVSSYIFLLRMLAEGGYYYLNGDEYYLLYSFFF